MSRSHRVMLATIAIRLLIVMAACSSESIGGNPSVTQKIDTVTRLGVWDVSDRSRGLPLDTIGLAHAPVCALIDCRSNGPLYIVSSQLPSSETCRGNFWVWVVREERKRVFVNEVQSSSSWVTVSEEPVSGTTWTSDDPTLLQIGRNGYDSASNAEFVCYTGLRVGIGTATVTYHGFNTQLCAKISAAPDPLSPTSSCQKSSR